MAGMKARAARHGLSGRISFPGYVTGDEKWRMLKACAVYALPTYMRSEAMPVALLEAMGAGKPVLAGPAGSISTIISRPGKRRVSARRFDGHRRGRSPPPAVQPAALRRYRPPQHSYAWGNF